jgi:hypothetical protein
MIEESQAISTPIFSGACAAPRVPFAWHGWTISIPSDWNPVKLIGDFNTGHALIADLSHPRMAIRWSTPPKKFNPTKWAKNILIEEIGHLAAAEAHPIDSPTWPGAILYTEPDPPGRDVFLAQSAISGRTVELVHNVTADEISQMDSLRASLSDSQPSQETNWSVFDLSCRIPAGWQLESHLLTAGDLKLNFTRGKNHLSLRQIAVAQLALKRMPLDRWLADHCKKSEPTKPITIQTPDCRRLEGLSCVIQKPKSFWKKHSPETSAMILHDPLRDKLLIVDGDDFDAVCNLATTVGCASPELVEGGN